MSGCCWHARPASVSTRRPRSAERGALLLERIADPLALNDLGEAPIDSPDGETWLKALSAAAG